MPSYLLFVCWDVVTSATRRVSKIRRPRVRIGIERRQGEPRVYIYILLKAKREEDSEQAQLGEPLRLCSLRLPHSLFGNKHAAALLFF
jgi:peptidyl-tRNA hydrolase